MLLSALLPVMMNEPSVPPFETPREFRAAWVATVANIDWPSKPGLDTASLKAEMTRIMDQSEQLGLNAIIFQVRPSADAMYASPHEPWSWFLTGEQGRAPADGFDPLKFAIDEAHARGIELHVWLNPYRAFHFRQGGPVHSTHISATHRDLVKKYGQFEWMDPGEEFVQDRSFEVFMDIVERYDIDGIHIDDYFYPYPVRGADGKWIDFPDEPSWRRALAKEPGLRRDEWRRRNVNRFIRRVHAGIKHRKNWVKFGISPFGIYRPGIPKGIRAGVDQYAELYADAKLWLELGWCDYFVPQLYWPIAQEAQSFPRLLDWWHSVNPKNRHMWPGQFTSRTNPQDGNWKAKEVIDQIELVRAKGPKGKTVGTVHFSFKALQANWNNVASALAEGPYRTKAISPSYPWLDKERPALPLSVAASAGDQSAVIRAEGDDVRFVALSLLEDGKWRLAKVGEPGALLNAPGLKAGMVFRATVIDKYGNESDPLVGRAAP